MTLTSHTILKPGLSQPFDPEEELLRHLVHSVSSSGICSDPVSIINLYVSLKSRPLAILAGPEKTGKMILVQCFAGALTGGDCLQCQMMKGHPWSAARSGNVSFFTEIHTRYNSEKLLCMIEEAWRLENSSKVYLACFNRISPAELEEFFNEISFQFQHGSIVRFGDVHLPQPIPFPPNLFLIGTMDTARFNWWDPDLLSSTTVIHWTEKQIKPLFCPLDNRFPSVEKNFLRSSLRNETAILKKLHELLAWQRQPFSPLLLIESFFEEETILLPYGLFKDALAFIANSWSSQGVGLFRRSTVDNLTIATDLAIAQTYLPRVVNWIRSSKGIQQKLRKMFRNNYPRADLAFAHLIE